MYCQILGPFKALLVSAHVEVLRFGWRRHVVPVEELLDKSRIPFSALTAMVTSTVTASPTWTRCFNSNFPNGFVTDVFPCLTMILYQVEKAL